MFDTEEEVARYIEMAEGYDGRALLPSIRTHVAPGGRVLELGMGPGKDLTVLAGEYEVVGTDRSVVFLDRYRRLYPDAVLYRADALDIDIPEAGFDAVFSNKVLHLVSLDGMAASLARQADLLVDGGVAVHGLWYGDGPEDYAGMHTENYTRGRLAPLIPDTLELVEVERYEEMDPRDSLRVVLRRLPRP